MNEKLFIVGITAKSFTKCLIKYRMLCKNMNYDFCIILRHIISLGYVCGSTLRSYNKWRFLISWSLSNPCLFYASHYEWKRKIFYVSFHLGIALQLLIQHIFVIKINLIFTIYTSFSC